MAARVRAALAADYRLPDGATVACPASVGVADSTTHQRGADLTKATIWSYGIKLPAAVLFQYMSVQWRHWQARELSN